MGLQKGIVKLEKYNPNWKNMFEEEKKNLEKLLKNKVISIEHLGSTSIERLSAKPIIDIMGVVENLKDVDEFKYLFTPHLGYDLKDDFGEKEEYLVIKGSEENRTHFIHIVEVDKERYKNFVCFKNYLLEHKEYIEKYEELKEDLSIKYEDDREKYTSLKNDFIQEVISLYKEENNL